MSPFAYLKEDNEPLPEMFRVEGEVSAEDVENEERRIRIIEARLEAYFGLKNRELILREREQKLQEQIADAKAKESVRNQELEKEKLELEKIGLANNHQKEINAQELAKQALEVEKIKAENDHQKEKDAHETNRWQEQEKHLGWFKRVFLGLTISTLVLIILSGFHTEWYQFSESTRNILASGVLVEAFGLVVAYFRVAFDLGPGGKKDN